MLKLILLEKAIDLYPLEFLINPDLPTTLVLPNPLLADNLRERFLDKDVDLITISRFVQNELEERKEDKAHLIFDLLKCYKKNFPQPSFEKFLHSFNHFTDLRSFTLEFSLIEEVLPHFDVEVAKALSLFWKEVDDNSLMDEHSSYHKLAEKFKDPVKTFPEKNIIFYGFNHLSNLQVEMVQALSKHYHIYVPFLKRVYLKCHSSDWIKWIDTTFDFREDLEENAPAKGKVAFYPENKMAQFLSACPIYPQDKKVDFYILSKNLDINQVSEIPIKDLNFKVKNDLFTQKLKLFFSELEGVDAHSKIETRFNEETKRAFDKLDFRLIKIITLIRENLKYFGKKLDRFELSALEYVVSLELPRTYTTALFSQVPKGEIRGKGSLLSYESQNLNIILVPSGDHAISVGTSKYPKEVEECLLAIGPVQNPYLEFLNTQEILREIFQDESTILISEYGSDKANEAVKQIISKIKITQKLEVDFGPNYLGPFDQLEKHITKEAKVQSSISATKLQTFLDCPRKFYFKYIGKFNSPEPKEIFSPLQLGNIEHAIMGKYLEKNSTFSPEIFQKTVEDEFEKYIQENKMQPTSLERESAAIEVRDYSFHGISELLKLKNIFSNCQFGFEKELIPDSEMPVNGRLDLILTCDEGYAILDFKRNSSPGLKNQLINFKKIQPWFYLNHYPIPGNNCLFLGYLVLSNPKDSLIICKEPKVKEKLELGDFQGSISFKEDERIPDLIKSFSEFEKQKFMEMNIEKDFFPIPSDPKICNYCTVNQVCPREVTKNDIT
ncbi:MAG: PD-(D/E)XK nuclease family protein [Bacteriovoracales bacterium]